MDGWDERYRKWDGMGSDVFIFVVILVVVYIGLISVRVRG